jgi:hypothetical protein
MTRIGKTKPKPFTTEDAEEHREARIKRSERQKLTTDKHE